MDYIALFVGAFILASGMLLGYLFSPRSMLNLTIFLMIVQNPRPHQPQFLSSFKETYKSSVKVDSLMFLSLKLTKSPTTHISSLMTSLTQNSH